MGNVSPSKCAVFGASGHGKVVAEIAELMGYSEVHFYDDRWPDLMLVEQWPVLGDMECLLHQLHSYSNVVVAIGDNLTRLNKYRLLKGEGAQCYPLVHPKAIVSSSAQIDSGTVVMASSVVSSFCKIGAACIINTSSVVEHDCTIADGVHISPGAKLAGNVSISSQSWLGIGCNIIQSINIGSNVVVGAGTTVIRDIANNQTVVGNPAKRICR